MSTYCIVTEDCNYNQLSRFLSPNETVTLIDIVGCQETIQKLETQLKENHYTVKITAFQDSFYTDIESVKEIYNEWIAGISHHKTKDGAIKDIFAYNDISLWWGTRLSEKNIFKSPQIFEALKLIHLETYLKDGKNILIISKNKPLIACITALCKKRNLPCNSVLNTSEKKRQRLKYYLLKRAKNSLILNLARTIMVQPRFKPRKQPKTPFSVISYYPNIDKTAYEAGLFQSNYWQQVQSFFPKDCTHLVYFNASSSLRKSDFQKHLKHYQNHNFDTVIPLFSSFSPSISVSLISTFLKLKRKLRTLNGAQLFQLPNQDLNLFPLFKAEWESTIKGAHLFALLKLLFLIKKQLDSLPNQKAIFYIMEMQGWECIFNQLVKSRWPNCKTIGITHIPIRANHIQYFRTKKEYIDYPYPTIIGICSPLNKQPFKTLPFYEKRVFNIEAQRFGYLESIQKTQENIFLITTGIDLKETQKMLKILDSFLKLGGRENIQIKIKGHPFSPIEPLLKDYDELSINDITHTPVSELLQTSKYVFAANSSSVLLESIELGILTYSVEGLESLSMCTNLNIQIVKSGEDLKQAMSTPKNLSSNELKNYFNIDKNYSHWRKLISENTAN